MYFAIPLRKSWQFTTFTSLVWQPPSSIAGYLRNVRKLYIWPNLLGLGWAAGEVRPWAHNILTQYAGHFPGLTYLDFARVDWRCAHDYSLRIGCTYRALTALVLNECTFTSVGQLHMLVTAFPALSDLTLEWIKLQSSEPSTIITRGHPLTRLTLRGITDDATAAVIQWLINTQLVQNLAALTWQCSNENYWKILTGAIDGASLQTLVFMIDYRWQGWNFLH